MSLSGFPRIATNGGLAAVACSVLMGLGGCATSPEDGYALATTYDASIRTVSVPMFKNNTFSPGIEVSLTEAVIKEIGRSTPWAVDQSGGDTTLTGTLASSDLRRLSSAPTTGYVQEVGVQMSVDFQWKDNRTGKTIVSRRNFTVMETFVPERQSGERLELGQAAAVDRLAREIVAELRSTW